MKYLILGMCFIMCSCSTVKPQGDRNIAARDDYGRGVRGAPGAQSAKGAEICSNYMSTLGSGSRECVNAAKNKGTGTKRFRAMSCTFRGGYIASTLRFDGSRWLFYTNDWHACDDNSVLIVKIQDLGSKPISFCTNAKSSNGKGACGNAAKNNGTGTRRFRAMSCKYQNVYVASTVAFRGGRWVFHTNDWHACDDGSLMVLRTGIQR